MAVTWLTFGTLCVGFIASSLAQEVTKVVITSASPEEPVTFRCGPDTWRYTWMRTVNDQNVTIDNNGSFEYAFTDPKASGTYYCQSSEGSATKFLAMNFTEPVIEHTSKSITVTEGDENSALICHSYSYPDPTFQWLMRKEGEEPVDLTSLSSGTYTVASDGTKSTLTISKVAMDVRAKYECRVENLAGNGTFTILVRVHARLAPLWAFLGIVAEIVLLAVIMLVVMRRTREKAAQVSAPAESTNPPAGQGEHSATQRSKED